MKEKTILFDLDGTLTDSGEGIMNCAEITLRQFGAAVPPREELRSIVGPPLKDSLLHFGIQEEHLNDAVNFYRKNYVATGMFENFPYPGISDVLAKLKADGHHLYVATSKPEPMAIEILRRFEMDGYFDMICGAAIDGSPNARNSKDTVIAYLLNQIGKQEDIVMVGDTIYDVLGAKAHNIPTIAVAWGYGVVEDMVKAGAIGVANTMDKLYNLI